MDPEFRVECKELLKRIVHLRDCLDLPAKTARIAEINDKMAGTDFWNNQERARQQTDELRKLKTTVSPLQKLVNGSEDLQVLMEFAEEDDSGESEAELHAAVERLTAEIERVELQVTMSNPADSCAAYLTVQAGEGGTDSADWAQMLLRMYIRWGERKGFKVEEIDISPAEEAGIRNATILITGEYVYGYLRGEMGNHRLIRISPFDSAGRRHTAFAAVDIVPDIEDEIEIDIRWDKDIKEDTYRSSGAGGQHINKTDSAVRLTHLPTGVVAACQNERSQHKNRATARKMLTAKLYQIEVDKREAEISARHGEKTKIGFGGQTVRNYVLHPDQFVKDARTGTKVGNPQPVLDGDLDLFLESYLRWTLAGLSTAEESV
ncbi:MAG: peptide chain release factor 2 [Fuerstia sp.]|nr:peptide chain release factor 2 [Fuerstiella sp.]